MNKTIIFRLEYEKSQRLILERLESNQKNLRSSSPQLPATQADNFRKRTPFNHIAYWELRRRPEESFLVLLLTYCACAGVPRLASAFPPSSAALRMRTDSEKQNFHQAHQVNGLTVAPHTSHTQPTAESMHLITYNVKCFTDTITAKQIVDKPNEEYLSISLKNAFCPPEAWNLLITNSYCGNNCST